MWGFGQSVWDTATLNVAINDSSGGKPHPGWTLEVYAQKPFYLLGGEIHEIGTKDAASHVVDIAAKGETGAWHGDQSYQILRYALPITVRYRISRKGSSGYTDVPGETEIDASPKVYDVTLTAH